MKELKKNKLRELKNNEMEERVGEKCFLYKCSPSVFKDCVEQYIKRFFTRYIVKEKYGGVFNSKEDGKVREIYVIEGLAFFKTPAIIITKNCKDEINSYLERELLK